MLGCDHCIKTVSASKTGLKTSCFAPRRRRLAAQPSDDGRPTVPESGRSGSTGAGADTTLSADQTHGDAVRSAVLRSRLARLLDLFGCLHFINRKGNNAGRCVLD